MSKRPRIRGRGADIYLGGDSAQRSDLRQRKSAGAQAGEKAQTEDKFKSVMPRGESSCVFDGMKSALACKIRNSERLANQAIALQEQSSRWAENTPLAPFFEMQASIARKIVECAATAARSFLAYPRVALKRPLRPSRKVCPNLPVPARSSGQQRHPSFGRVSSPSPTRC